MVTKMPAAYDALSETDVSQPSSAAMPAVSAEAGSSETGSAPPAAIDTFARFLTVWVLLAMAVGVLVGYYVPAIPDALESATVAQISIPIAIFIWIMVYPMLLQIDLTALQRVRYNLKPILVTTGINYLIQPFCMYGLAKLFIDVAFEDVISDQLQEEYVTGAVILGGSPCTAMVFVWSALVSGDAAYTLVQVAVNDILIFILYIPTMMLLLQASSIPLPWGTAFLSLALFMCVPGLAALGTRAHARRHGGDALLQRIERVLKPFTMIALIAVLVLIFIFQGQAIVDQPVHVLLIAVPLTIQTYFIFGLAYSVMWYLRVPFCYAAPGALIATSNFFELAVALAISLEGADSGATLATVVGVLEEVPIMLSLVWLCNRTQHWFPEAPKDTPLSAAQLDVEMAEQQNQEPSTEPRKVPVTVLCA
ncbi:uncharacterized protein MONBRDRAFT_5977 [Monosiga brevicollis MX1]|uniref:Arsenical-resistance protein n=1 Tax=Monosiga brevicollis TaxID=81824 RepID=A9UR81_MONBE|nr:uncharacterized protein MONBRDRAFT_5977 [Monosiga brevicollis MX1]EDQ91878.1 predicted protein [Monosiga brevicollis MX1]|eukprot:XP_001743164.1 hypothetical protein [Monosiga brevicollis MX1]